jgi:hypothetical protein
MSLKHGLLYLALLVASALATETLSSALLFYYYKPSLYSALYDPELSGPSTVVLLRLACERMHVCAPTLHDRTTSDPSPLYSADPHLGYAPRPGRYIIQYTKPNRFGGEDRLKTVFTVNSDGSRFVGARAGEQKRNIYIFGDSYIAGEGVNDEQTFASLLQSAFPGERVALYAAGGYSLTQAYIRFEQLRAGISENDLIVLGYADWYKVRHVAAPSRLREYGGPRSIMRDAAITHPRAGLDAEGRLVVDFVPLFCQFNLGYCDQADPPAEYLDRVTAALINAIAEQTKATVVLLHFAGNADDPVLAAVSKRVRVLSALEEDFDYVIRDDVMHFDAHPGPYWHYAMYTKLAAFLRANGYEK